MTSSEFAIKYGFVPTLGNLRDYAYIALNDSAFCERLDRNGGIALLCLREFAKGLDKYLEEEIDLDGQDMWF